MEIIVSTVIGLASFWIVFAVFVWLFHTAMQFWLLVICFAVHWLIYRMLFIGDVIDLASTVNTALGWFVIAPIVGGGWLALRRIYASQLHLDQEVSDEDRTKLENAASLARSSVFTASTLGTMNFMATSGAAVPLVLGIVYVVLKWYRLVP